MSNKAIAGIWKYINSIGVNPWALFAILGIAISVVSIKKGDLRNWEQLSTPTKMNNITIYGATLLLTIFAILNMLGVITH